MGKIASLLVTVLSVAIYQFYDLYLSITPCSEDPKITMSSPDDGNHSWDACYVYSLEYTEARDKFRAAAQTANAQLHSLPIVLDDENVDDWLTTDVAVVPGNRPGVIVHSSATHGIEGFAGSAVQLALLQDLPNQKNRPTLIFVHAINPYGMKHYRRFNENSVDLSRSGLLNFEQFLKDRDPDIAQRYDNARYFVSPARAPTTWDKTFGYFWTGIPLLWSEGYTEIKRVLVSGQYHHPEGPFFGGTQLQPSLVQLQEFLQSQGLLNNNDDNDPPPIIWIDVHTGLGKFGKDTLLFESPVPLPTLQKLFPTAENWVAPQLEDKKAMSGYDLTKGTITTFFQGQSSKNSFYVTQEFGTIPGLLVGRALILENMMHHFGSDKASGRQWMQSAFYPQSTVWRASIVQRGVSLMLQAIDYAKSHESSSGSNEKPATSGTTNAEAVE